MKSPLTLLERILSRCVLGATSYNDLPCWVFLGCHCNKGYPKIMLSFPKRFSARVHRVLWELVKGRTIADGMTLDHLCLNTSCVRPEHLEEVSRPVNTARGNRTRHRKELRV